ncbi:MAG: hypothetical protein KIT11_08850 [Fimbriimonadaceae bacterium]|nr:hypothetical protein [Fimbriimonadaceae bacterium]QYK55435.1 MAG: hypothetical protein KF733_10520 [Fimbriimonadaceae bacterium]
MRTIAISISLGLFSLSLAQEPTVSLACEGWTVPQVLEGLSAKTGQKHSADASFASTPLLIAAKEVDAATLREKIAAVVAGSWRKTEGGYILEPDAAALNRRKAEAVQRRANALAESLKKRLDSIKPAVWDRESARKAIGEERRRREEMNKNFQGQDLGGGNAFAISVNGGGNSQGPAEGALVAALRSLSPHDLANLQPGDRIVYSTRPTARQKPTQFDGTAALARFVDAYNVIADESKGFADEFVNVRHMGGLPLGAEPISAATCKLLLVVSRPPIGDGIEIVVKVADAAGKIVGSADASLGAASSVDAPALAERLAKAKVRQSALGRELAAALADPDTANSAQVMTVRMGAGTAFVASPFSHLAPLPLSDELAAAILDPARFDPAKVLLGGPLQNLPAGMNVVASVPDAALKGALRELASTEATYQTLLNALARGGYLTVDSAEDWLTLSPRNPVDAARLQAPRKETTEYLGAIKTKGYDRLFEAGRFALALGKNPTAENLAFAYIRAYAPVQFGRLRFWAEQGLEHLQLYALLTQGQVEAQLGEAQAYRLATLDPGKRGLLERLVYGASGSARMGLGFMSLGIRAESGGRPGGPLDLSERLSSEPTEAFPQGLPGEAVLRIQPEESEAVFGTVPRVRGGRFYSAETLGIEQAFGKNGDLAPSASLPTLFQQARQRTLTMTCSIGDQTLDSTDFDDAWVVAGSLPVDFARLPDDFKERVANQQAAMAERPLRMGPGRIKPPL